MEIEALLLQMVASRAPKSLCPSEVARRYEENRTGATEESWRQWMEPVRTAVRLLAALGKVQVMQNNRVIDAGTLRGPIRIRLTPTHGES